MLKDMHQMINSPSQWRDKLSPDGNSVIFYEWTSVNISFNKQPSGTCEGGWWKQEGCGHLKFGNMKASQRSEAMCLR